MKTTSPARRSNQRESAATVSAGSRIIEAAVSDCRNAPSTVSARSISTNEPPSAAGSTKALTGAAPGNPLLRAHGCDFRFASSCRSRAVRSTPIPMPAIARRAASRSRSAPPPPSSSVSSTSWWTTAAPHGQGTTPPPGSSDVAGLRKTTGSAGAFISAACSA
ncbi:MAG: hypothetical protein ABFD65_11580 [Candidatus Polarisedimenticolia bacterium]